MRKEKIKLWLSNQPLEILKKTSQNMEKVEEELIRNQTKRQLVDKNFDKGILKIFFIKGIIIASTKSMILFMAKVNGLTTTRDLQA